MPLPTMLRPGLYRYPEGSYLSEKEYRDENEELPINVICSSIINKLSHRSRGIEDRVKILVAFTGSGKSTVGPQELLKQVGQKYNRGICVAEPRVDLCTNGVNDILSYNKDWSYGVEMGKLTGASKVRATKLAHICFMTTQILQNYINSIFLAYNSNDMRRYRRLLNRYVVVVIDEAHTHDVQTLSTIAAIKQLLVICGSEQLCPLFIFTSATLDVDQFIRFFGLESVEKKEIVGTVLPIANHEIENLYLGNDEVERVNANTSNRALKYNDIYSQMGRYVVERFREKLEKCEITALDGKAKCRDLLVFVPGIRAITSMLMSIFYGLGNEYPKILVTTELTIIEFEKWREANRGRDRYVVMGFSSTYSSLSSKLLEKPFSDDEDVLKHEMRWIVSTGAIESGKTIGTLEICCDFGFDNKPINMPLTWKFGSKGFVVQIPACKNQITQRRGRVGRLAPGTFLTFYTEECLNVRPIDDLPDTVNMGCLSQSLYAMYIQPTRTKSLIDLCLLNDNLFPIPPDLLISSGRDLIYGGVLGTNGEWLGEEIEDQWLRYARIAYYIMRKPLYESLVLGAINQYSLPPKFEIDNIDESIFTYTLDKALEKKDSKIGEFIVQARSEFIKIVEGKSLTIVPYRGDWY